MTTPAASRGCSHRGYEDRDTICAWCGGPLNQPSVYDLKGNLPMTDADNGTAAAAPASVPTFTTIAVSTLPKPKKTRTAEDTAYALALHAAIADGKQAAQESTVHTDAAAAQKRAAQLKRLLRPDAPKGKTIGARTVTVDGGFAVAVFLADAPAPKVPAAVKA